MTERSSKQPSVIVTRYLSQHYLLGLNREPNYDFLGHPLNAYFFVRHVAHGWTMIKRSLAGIDTNKTTELGKSMWCRFNFSMGKS